MIQPTITITKETMLDQRKSFNHDADDADESYPRPRYRRSSSLADLPASYGICFWGLIISTILLGVSVVQGYIYFKNDYDAWFMKSFVAVLLTLDVTGTILVADSIHFYLAQNFGNETALARMTKPFLGEIALSVIIKGLSQLFYAGRIYKAGARNHGRYAALIVVILSIFTFGVGVVMSQLLWKNGRFIRNLDTYEYKVVIGLFNFSAAFCDAVATLFMFFFLSSLGTSFNRTKSILNWLLFFSINRGFLVCVTQIAFVIAYLVWPQKAYWMPIHLTISKLHVNTLLAMLNSRALLRSRLEEPDFHLERNRPINLGRFIGRQDVIDYRKHVEVSVNAGKVVENKSQPFAARDERHELEVTGVAEGLSIA